jgi:hypothetical protein
MPDDTIDLRTPPTGPSAWAGAVATVIGDHVLVARSFRDHPTQLVEGPDRNAYLVEVKSPFARAVPHTDAVGRRWTVEVSAPGPDGLGPVVLCENHASEARGTRRARAIRRAIRRGAFLTATAS